LISFIKTKQFLSRMMELRNKHIVLFIILLIIFAYFTTNVTAAGKSSFDKRVSTMQPTTDEQRCIQQCRLDKNCQTKCKQTSTTEDKKRADTVAKERSTQNKQRKPTGKVAGDATNTCSNLYGDINADGTVNMFDSWCYQTFLVQSNGDTPGCMKISEQCADLNCDDKISVLEALATAQKFKLGKFHKNLDFNKNDIPDCKEKLKCGTFLVENSNYTQMLRFQNDNTVKLVFAQDNDVAPNAGTYFYFSDAYNVYAWNYTLGFKDPIEYKNASDLIGLIITIIGKNYTILDANMDINGKLNYIKLKDNDYDKIIELRDNYQETIINGIKNTFVNDWYSHAYFDLIISNNIKKLKGIHIRARPDTDSLYLIPGDMLVDPVFGGFKIVFSELVNGDTEVIQLNASNQNRIISFKTREGKKMNLPLTLKDNIIYLGEDVNSNNIVYLEGDQCFTEDNNLSECQNVSFLVSSGLARDGHLI